MGKRQIAAMQTRLNLLTAAEKLIAEKGFECVTITDIVREAHVSIGCFYTYFRHKEDIVNEIAKSNFSVMEAQSRSVAGDVCEKIGDFLTKSMRYVMDSGLHLAQQWQINIVDPDNQDGKKKLVYDRSVIHDLLQTAVQQRELSADTPVEQFRDWITAQYYGSGVCWCITNGATDPAAQIEQYCQVMLRNALAPYRTDAPESNKGEAL